MVGRAIVVLVCIALLPAGAAAAGEVAAPAVASRAVVIPQVGVLGDEGDALRLERVDVHLRVLGKSSVVTITSTVRNTTKGAIGFRMLLPVPDGTRVESVACPDQPGAPKAMVLPERDAYAQIEGLAARTGDPSPMEFVGGSAVLVHSVAVPANGTTRVAIMYSAPAAMRDDRIDATLPRSERTTPAAPWFVRCEVSVGKAISTVYSPSHPILVQRLGEGRFAVELPAKGLMGPGPFRLSAVFQPKDGPGGTVYAYPETDESGAFLLLIGPPAAGVAESSRPIAREWTFLIDASASMRGSKISRVCGATRAVLAELGEQDRFNLYSYNVAVTALAEKPVAPTEEALAKADEFLKSIDARGGSNLFDGLQQALAQPGTANALPTVLLLTDGVPTVGPNSEREIRRLVTHANPSRRRIFAVGLGGDVNAVLLQDLAGESRGRATFVLAEKELEQQLRDVFAALAEPVFANLDLVTDRTSGVSGPAERVSHVVPNRLPDLYARGQIVLIGRYTGAAPIPLTIQGNLQGRERAFRFIIDPAQADRRNAFVQRLWADRRIGELVARIRSVGAKAPVVSRTPGSESALEAGIVKLSDEIVRLSAQNGVFNKQTEFIAAEANVDLPQGKVYAQARENFKNQIAKVRLGVPAVQQAMSQDDQYRRSRLNEPAQYDGEPAQAPQETAVRWAGDLVFYRRADGWIDARLAARERVAGASRIVAFGTEPYRELARQLARDGRQGALALRGNVLLAAGDGALVITGPRAAQTTQKGR